MNPNEMLLVIVYSLLISETIPFNIEGVGIYINYIVLRRYKHICLYVRQREGFFITNY